MKKIQMVGVAIAMFGGMAFAQLWTPKSPNGQVQFPWVVECTSSDAFDPGNEDDDCYKKMGGFWWGYLVGSDGFFPGSPEEVGPRACAGMPGQTVIGGPISGINKVEAFIDNKWVNFNGTDNPKCVGPDVTNRKDGKSLIGDALQVKMTIGSGWIEDPHYFASTSGFGVTLVEKESESTPRDVSDHDGFCMTYASDHENTKDGNEGTHLEFKLGWNEGYESEPEKNDHWVKGVDEWYAIVPPSGGLDKIISKDFKWTGEFFPSDVGGVPQEKGDFIQDNYSSYASWQGIVAGAPLPIESATKELTSIKIVWTGYNNPGTITFKLYEFGWAGTCGKNNSPIVARNVRPASSVGFEMIGKTLSMNSKVGPVAVQVINLQGAVVQSKTMSNGDKLSLQNLPTGIYMIRVPSQNYTVKQIVK